MDLHIAASALTPSRSRVRFQSIRLRKERLRSKVTHAKRFMLNDEGSAVLEFVAIAIPLFVPMVLFLAQLNSSIQSSMFLHNLARQAARAYSTASDESTAALRVQTLLNSLAGTNSTPSDSVTQSDPKDLLHFNLQCSSSPCLQPDSRIQVTVTLNGRSATASQVVDAW